MTWADWFKAGNVGRRRISRPRLRSQGQSQSSDHRGDRAGAEQSRGSRRAPGQPQADQPGVAAGAIAGVTTVLERILEGQDPRDAAWRSRSPSMGGSGDRMAICWAVFGQAPDLSLGIDPIEPAKLYHCVPGARFRFSPATACAAARGVPHLQRLQQVPGPGRLRLRAGDHRRRHLQPCHGHGRGPAERRSPGRLRRPVDCDALFGAERQQVRDLRRLRGADLGLADLPEGAGNDAAVRLHRPPATSRRRSRRCTIAAGESVHDVAYRAYRAGDAAPRQDAPATPPPPSDMRLAFPPST